MTPLEKTRKFLVLRTFNTLKGKSTESFRDFFASIAIKNDKGKPVISSLDLKKILQLDDKTENEITQIFIDSNAIDLELWLQYLRYGKIPYIQKVSHQDPKSKQHNDNFPSSSNKLNQSEKNQTRDEKLNTGYPRIEECIDQIIYENLHPSTMNAITHISNTLYTEEDEEKELLKTALIKIPTHSADTDESSSSNNIGPIKNIWRKCERVKQERMTSYIAIDSTGQRQELCEKETTITEILHMENRETGEFAHRETTKVHNLETFNKEIVVDDSGKEEYIHMKSLDNEIELMESNLPKKQSSPAAEGEDDDMHIHPEYLSRQEGDGSGEGMTGGGEGVADRVQYHMSYDGDGDGDRGSNDHLKDGYVNTNNTLGIQPSSQYMYDTTTSNIPYDQEMLEDPTYYSPHPTHPFMRTHVDGTESLENSTDFNSTPYTQQGHGHGLGQGQGYSRTTSTRPMYTDGTFPNISSNNSTLNQSLNSLNLNLEQMKYMADKTPIHGDMYHTTSSTTSNKYHTYKLDQSMDSQSSYTLPSHCKGSKS